MIRAYIAMSKPASPIITEYGDDFPDFIAAFEPAATVRYLADVARLEAAWTRAYHAADAEPLAIAALAALDGAALTNRASRRIRRPCCCTPLSPLAASGKRTRAEAIGNIGARGSECVLVARPVFDVSVHILPEQDAAFAVSLFAGETIGAAAETASAANPEFEFGPALIGLVSLGAFTEITIWTEHRPMVEMINTNHSGGIPRAGSPCRTQPRRDPRSASAPGIALRNRRAVLLFGADEVGRLPDALLRRSLPLRRGVQAAHIWKPLPLSCPGIDGDNGWHRAKSFCRSFWFSALAPASPPSASSR